MRHGWYRHLSRCFRRIYRVATNKRSWTQAFWTGTRNRWRFSWPNRTDGSRIWINRSRNGSHRAMRMRTLIRGLMIVTRKLRQKRIAEAGNDGKRSDVFHGFSVCCAGPVELQSLFSVWFALLFSFIFLIASSSDLCRAEWREAASIIFYDFKCCCGTSHNFMIILLSERDRLRNWFAILCANEHCCCGGQKFR